MNRLGSIARKLLIELYLPLTLFAIAWQFNLGGNSLAFPEFRDAVNRSVELATSSEFARDQALPSLLNLAVGLSLAIPGGIAAGVLLASNPRLLRACNPLLQFMRSLPAVVLLPVILLFFGIGASMKIFIIFYGAVWVILLNTIDGVRSTSSVVKDVSSVYRLGPRDRVFRVLVPSAMPSIVAGMRTAFSLSLLLVIVSEMIASTNGLGYFVLKSQRSFEIVDMWAGTILIGMIGYAINLAFRLVERALIPWAGRE